MNNTYDRKKELILIGKMQLKKGVINIETRLLIPNIKGLPYSRTMNKQKIIEKNYLGRNPIDEREKIL